MSDILSLVRMRGEFVCISENLAPWSFRFSDPVARFHLIERGAAWVVVDGEAVVRLEAGDLVLMPLGAGHVLCSDPVLPATPIERAIADHPSPDGVIYRMGGGGESTHVICGQFSFSGVLAPRLLAVLPAFIHIAARLADPQGWLRLTGRFLADETRRPRPGSASAIARLIDLIFIQTIRQWGAERGGGLGWLSGLTDPQVGRALSAIHDDPARAWTVGALAARAGMSRSAFAARFAGAVGQTPLRYLASWRLNLAADHLRAGAARIGEIATLVGYGSEAALARAFKAQFGKPPAAFRRDARRSS